MTSRINLRPACGCSFFYLSLRLVLYVRYLIWVKATEIDNGLSMQMHCRAIFRCFLLTTLVDTYFLQVYSSTLSEKGHVGTYCGSSPPSTISTNSSIMYILFNNVGSIANTGFKAHYLALCEVYLFGSSGYFSSLDTDYTGRGQNCTWIIAANSSQIIRLEIEGMYDGVWSKHYCNQYERVCYHKKHGSRGM